MKCVRCHSEIQESFKACPHCGEPVTEFLRRHSAQPIDGKYEILERLGAGGMGEVFKVRHTYLGAMRVIKVIRPQIAENQDANDRFLREAQMATKVHHHNVATLHDFSALPDGSHYMVWEYIEGENVAQRMKTRGALPPAVAVKIAIDALHGLEAIHRAGIVHRDISPENLMLSDGSVKIIDLGVAKAEEIDSGTKTGIFVGKLRYASPEQLGFLADGEKIDGRADLYSLAIVLYEMLTGRPPFEAKSPHEYVVMHSREAPPRPIEISHDLPGGDQLQRILQRALENDRSRRFANAAEFAAALDDVLRSLPKPDPARTMAVPFDGDATARLHDTLHQSTIHDAPPTIRTPLPTATARGTARTAETVRAQLPAETVHVPLQPPVRKTARADEPKAKTSPLLLGVAVAIMVLIAAIVIVTLVRRTPNAAPPVAAQPSAARPAQSTIDVAAAPTAAAAPEAVTTTTSAVVPLTATTATQPAAPPQPKKVAAATPPAETHEEPARESAPAAPAPRYVDGGDGDANDAAMRHLQEQLSGVKRLSIRGSNAELVKELTDILGKRVTVADDADVTIDFNGTLDHLGRGRKRRAATAVVSKHGRAVFQYELPAEEYRVGDDPAEAFARVMRDGLQ